MKDRKRPMEETKRESERERERLTDKTINQETGKKAKRRK